MFTYCGNNPVKNIDETGTFFFTAVGAVAGFISGAVIASLQGKSSQECLNEALSGALGGAIAGAGVDIGLAIIGSCGMAAPAIVAAGAVAFMAGGTGNALTTSINTNGTATNYELTTAFLIGGVGNVVSLGTSMSAVASSIGAVAVGGMQNFTANLNTSIFVAYTAGVLTTVAQSLAMPWNNPPAIHVSSAAFPWLDPNYQPYSH